MSDFHANRRDVFHRGRLLTAATSVQAGVLLCASVLTTTSVQVARRPNWR
jgi:hypothetical protein